MAPGSGVGDAVGEGVVTGADCMAPGSGVRNGVGEGVVTGANCLAPGDGVAEGAGWGCGDVVGEGTGAGPLFC